jgi:hypothetical protein
MQKIISLFCRNYETDHLVRNDVVPGAEWVIAGEGIATRKFDGTCCLVKDGKLYKRHDVKKGKEAPAGFIAAQEPDQVTGHWPGWLQVGDGPEDAIHREAMGNYSGTYRPGTYELVGPKINKNPDNFPEHCLVPHGQHQLPYDPRDYELLKQYLQHMDIEGIVWHHPDGRKVKIKKRDFGFKR